MLQGRLEICRVEIQRLEDKIEQLTHGMTANNTPRLLLPMQDDDARDSDPDQQWREATRKKTNKASGRRRKKKTTTKTTKKKGVLPTAAKKQAKGLFTRTVLKDPELERLRQDIVQIILGSKIYNSGKSNQIYRKIMQTLEHNKDLIEVFFFNSNTIILYYNMMIFRRFVIRQFDRWLS